VISENTETALIVSHRVWVKNENYWNVFFDISERSRGALISSGFSPPARQIEVKREK
jgi:hypothetical protein